MPKTTLAIELNLEDKMVKAICGVMPGDSPAPIKVGRAALGLLQDLYEGGIMLPAEAVNRIQKAISSIQSEDIVARLEDSANKKDDHMVLRLEVDPIWELRLKEIAEVRGHTVDQLLQECMATAISQGWLYDNVIPQEPPPVSFSRSDYESIRQVVSAGGAVFGEDIAAWVRGHSGVNKNADL
jgi:hypothetical protein